jgi:hypothetical protein
VLNYIKNADRDIALEVAATRNPQKLHTLALKTTADFGATV